MKPKLKKNVEKASSAVEKETGLNENNTQEVNCLSNSLLNAIVIKSLIK